MRSVRLLMIVVGLGLVAVSACGQGTPSTSAAQRPVYDAALAQRLGADEHGMRKYVFVMLKRGKIIITDPKEKQDLLAGHMKNIGRLAEAGKLVLAGPFFGDQDLRGLFIFNVTTVEEAQQLVQTDPSIKAGMFEVEMYPWYGSAALMDLNRIHESITKESVTK